MSEQHAHHDFDTSPHPALLGISRIEMGGYDSGAPGMVTRRMCEYRAEKVHWLEPGRIAMGKLNMIAGDPGLGKSFMTLELAARASRGEIGSACGQVVIMSAEDDPNDTLQPRLRNMCANLNNIHFIEGIRRGNGEFIDQPMLDQDIERLQELIEDHHPVSLIIIDPISAYMGKADSNNNAEVRTVLANLAALAQRTGAAVVCVSHLNKDNGSGKKAVYRTMGSLAFTAAARTVQLVTKYQTTDGQNDPNAREKRIVSMVKNNLGKILPARVYILRDPGICTWLDEEVDVDADIFANGKVTFDAPETKIDHAVALLQDELRMGERPAGELLQIAKDHGISKTQMTEARQLLCVTSRKTKAGWVWSMPEHENDFEDPEGENPPPGFREILYGNQHLPYG